MLDELLGRLTCLSRRLLKPREVPPAPLSGADFLPQAAPPSGDDSPAQPSPSPLGVATGMSAVTDFGDNPGGLRTQVYVPPTLRSGAPLLVLLHGCGQDAANFAAASGFTALADRLGAALLLPEQVAANNPGRCFNWFRPKDIRAGDGEVESIRQMVAAALDRCAADPHRVFVAGLSAGGAMAAALLAAYPDLFAGGGVVAGLPVGAATDVSTALARMTHAERVEGLPGGLDRVGRWPPLSVWHGAADRTVDPANGDALVAQWAGLLGLAAAPDAIDSPAPGVTRRRWGGAVEQWSLDGFGHGFPVLAQVPADPFVLPAPVQAADAMARFWGLDRG